MLADASSRSAAEPAALAAATRASRLAGQFGWVSGGRLLGALIQAGTLVLVARWAGTTGFGAVGIALAIVVVLQTVTDLGLPTFIIRERAARPDSPTIRRALQVNNTTARWMALLLAAIFGSIALMSESPFLQLLPLALWAAADRNTDTWLGVTLADGDARVNSVTAVSRRLSVVVMMILLYWAGMPPLLAFSIALAVVGGIVNYVVHRYVSRRVVQSSVRPPVRPILRESFPYWLNSTATQVRNLDTLIVGVLTGTTQVAFYAAASRITGPLRILPTSLATVLVPAATRAGVTRLKLIAKPIAIVLGATSLLYGSVLIAAPWAVPLALGTEFAGAVLPVQIVCGGLIFAATGSILTAILQGIGRGQAVARIAVATTALCLAGVVIGSVLWGAIGAAAALSTSFVVQTSLLAAVLRRARSIAIQQAGAAQSPGHSTVNVAKGT